MLDTRGKFGRRRRRVETCTVRILLLSALIYERVGIVTTKAQVRKMICAAENGLKTVRCLSLGLRTDGAALIFRRKLPKNPL